MTYCIENEVLKIQVHSMGAQLMSLYSKKTQTEYLWQGDPAYWTGRAYNLFPFIGRAYEGVFRYDGREYPSRSHGLARYFEFALETQTKDSLVFLMTSNEETKKEYPFDFEFRVYFLLDGATLTVRYTVTNTDSRELICAFGGHPGINVPFGAGEFEDYYLDFGERTEVSRQLLAEGDKFMADQSVPYELVDGVKLPLRHDLFDHDAVILENTSRVVSVKSDKERRYVTMKYDDYKFIGFWHACRTDAPYVCLEPWSALPSVDGAITDLETKPNMTRVAPSSHASATYSLEIHE